MRSWMRTLANLGHDLSGIGFLIAFVAALTTATTVVVKDISVSFDWLVLALILALTLWVAHLEYRLYGLPDVLRRKPKLALTSNEAGGVSTNQRVVTIASNHEALTFDLARCSPDDLQELDTILSQVPWTHTTWWVVDDQGESQGPTLTEVLSRTMWSRRTAAGLNTAIVEKLRASVRLRISMQGRIMDVYTACSEPAHDRDLRRQVALIKEWADKVVGVEDKESANEK